MLHALVATERTNPTKVWINRDLAPDASFGPDDGRCYIKESAESSGAEKMFDGIANPAGSDGIARIPAGALERVIESAEE